MANAIYFNAKWKYQFDKEETYQGNFYRGNGVIHEADFMKVNGEFMYTATEDFSAVELPYGDSTFSMVVILPAAGKESADIIGQMDAGQWETWFEASTMEDVQVELPKFKYGFKNLLNDPLINLGLGVAFSGADF